MPPFDTIIYIALAIIALYLVYLISVNVVWFFAKVVIYIVLLVGILWFLYKNGVLDKFLK